MLTFDRRKLLHAGMAFAVPMGAMSLLGGCQKSNDSSEEESSQAGQTENSVVNQSNQKSKGEMMQVQYLEIVTPEVEALCKQYSAVHGITFGEPDKNLGNARTAQLNGGGMIGIRGPMRESETPVIRPYVLVEDLEKAVAAAKDAGAQIALPKMEIPGHGTIGIVIHGGIECGLWQA